MVITQPFSKLTLLEEQAVSTTDYTGHGPWSCKTVYVDASETQGWWDQCQGATADTEKRRTFA